MNVQGRSRGPCGRRNRHKGVNFTKVTLLYPIKTRGRPEQSRTKENFNRENDQEVRKHVQKTQRIKVKE